MERLLELVHLVVEVVADLVNQRAQERAERDDLLPLRGAHPHGDARRDAALLGLVEAVQFAVVGRRALREHAHADRRHAVAGGQRVGKPLARALAARAIVGLERARDRIDVRTRREARGQVEAFDRVARPVDALAGGREPVVVGEGHGNGPRAVAQRKRPRWAASSSRRRDRAPRGVSSS